MASSYKRHILYRCIALLVLFSAAISGSAAPTLAQAKELYSAGKYAEAIPAFQVLLSKKPKDAALNHWYGVCLYETGKYAKAEKYLRIGSAQKILESDHYLGKLCSRFYRFEEAAKYYKSYRDGLQKNKQAVPETLLRQIEAVQTAAGLLRDVEQIQVIDSLLVNKSEFFKEYRLSPGNGKIEESLHPGIDGTAFTDARGKWQISAHPDDNHNIKLVERTLSDNGIWGEALPLEGGIATPGNQNYPFLTADGSTLYYASDGDGSIGGYDIFATRYNAGNHQFSDPRNIGMPFNSPYDDYLLAIDETLHVGWFATDRLQIPDTVAIYLFIVNIEREAYPAETANLASLARIGAIEDSWPEDADYDELLDSIDAIDEAEEAAPTGKDEIYFPLQNEICYTRFDEFGSEEALNFYKKAIELQKESEAVAAQLRLLRRQYGQADNQTRQQLAPQLLDLEKKSDDMIGKPEYWMQKARETEIHYWAPN